MPKRIDKKPEDYDIAAMYEKSVHKKRGDLHERMKWLMGCVVEMDQALREVSDSSEEKALFLKLQQAALDLETEVAFTRPASPAHTARSIPPKSNFRQVRYVNECNPTNV